MIYDAMEMHIPKVKLKSYKSPKWFKSDIRHCLNCLHSLRRKYPTESTNLFIRKYSTGENILCTDYIQNWVD